MLPKKALEAPSKRELKHLQDTSKVGYVWVANIPMNQP